MSNINKHSLQLGDIVHVPLVGFAKHYGVVIQSETLFQEAIIRTVLRKHSSPVDQTESQFSQGAKISVLPYQSELSRYVVAQNAMNIRSFKYNLLTNNCEHFYRRAWGLSDVSYQVLFGGLVFAGCLAFTLKTKRLPIKV